MSFLVLNKTAGALVINDLGLTIPAATGGSPEPGLFDLSFEDPKQVAKSDDLVSQIQAGNLVVLDPLNSVTELSAAISEEIIRVHNDPHYRIRGGTLNQLEDVNLDVAGSPQVLTNTVLQWNNSDAFEPVSPDTIVSDGSDAVQDVIASTLVDGNDTTITFDGSPFTTIQVDVDDVFLRNTGDTLDSGTLTIASGATVDFVSGSTLTIQDGATATITTPTGGFDGDTDIVNKAYVDSVAAGLDPKESVRVATEPGDTSGTYVAGSPCGPGDTITGFPGIIDSVQLETDDRVLVKDRTNAAENGIYVVSSVVGSPVGSPVGTVTLTRATDQDGTPNNEVSSGNFTHVEQGSTNINTKWVVTGDGLLTICTDDINWVLFSGPDAIVVDIGLTRTANTISLDLSTTELTTATPALADRIAFHDDDGAGQSPTGTQTYGATFTSTYNAHDVVYGISSNGILVRTADDTYASRTITSSTADDRIGLEVLDGDGVSGNPTIGLDIENLPYYSSVGSPLGTIDSTDRVAVYDVSNDRNVYYQVSDIAGALASTNSFETWAGGGNTSGDAAIVADSSTDTATLAGGTGINVGVTAASDTLTLDLSFDAIPATGSPLTVDTSDEVIINNGGTIEKATLSDIIDALGLSTTDELVKISANDTTAGYLNGKLVAGTYTTLTENNDGGNETLTVDVDPSTIELGDLGDVIYGSPLPQAGDLLYYAGSPGGWTTFPSSDLSFDVCTLSDGSTATLDLTDEIAVCDSGSTVKFSFGDTFDTLGVPSGITDVGFVVRTSGSPTAYASRTIAVEGPGVFDGLSITNGDGSAGDPTLGLDITGTPGKSADIEASDEFIIHNTTGSPAANEKVTGQEVADGVATILGFGGLSVQPIGGSGSPAQFTLFLTDDVRAKDLSTNEFSLTWAEASVGNNDWLEIGNANDADVSFVVPMNATIVRATAFSVNAGSNKDIDLYIDAALDGTLVTIPSGTNTSVEDVTLDIDVTSGQRLRLRGGSGGGTIQDATVILWLKWRA